MSSRASSSSRSVPRRSSASFLVAVAILLHLSFIANLTHGLNPAAELDEDFAFDRTEDFFEELEIDKAGKPWGVKVKNYKAPVGRIFHMYLPEFNTNSTNVKYEAKTENGGPLPAWLVFDKKFRSFWGVPSSRDSGELNIVAKAHDNDATINCTFKITIDEDAFQTWSRRKCQPKEDYTLLHLIIDRDLDAIKPKQRVLAINYISGFLGLPSSAFYLSEQKQPDDISDSSVMLAGPGDAAHSKTAKVPSSLQVAVGCEGTIWPEDTSMVYQLKKYAREGVLSEVLRMPLIGWRIKTDFGKHSLRRKRRHAINDESGSGDYIDDYDYGDEEYDEDDYSGADELDRDSVVSLQTTKKPTTTTTTTTTSTTTTTTSTTTTTTPEPSSTTTTTKEELPVVVPTVVPHTTHGHRHHHGENIPLEIIPPTLKVVPLSPLTTTEAATRIFIDVDDDDEGDDEGDDEEEEPIPDDVITEKFTPPSTTTSTSTTTTTTSTTTTKEPEIVTEKIDIPKIYDLDNYEDYDDEDLDEDAESETIVPEVNRQVNSGSSVIGQEQVTSSSSSSTSTTSSTTSTTTTTTTEVPSTLQPEIMTTTSTEKPLPTTVLIATTNKEVREELVPPTPPTIQEEDSTTTLTSSTTSTELPSTSIVTVTEQGTTLNWRTSTIRLTTEEELSTATKQTTQRHVPSTPKTTTEFVITEMKNFAPNVRNRLDRIAVRAGKYFSYTLPKDTFWDMEDGDDLKYEVFTNDREPLSKDSWLQFNQHTREFYGLPLDVDVSKWKYTVVATDSEGLSASDTLELVIQQSRTHYTVHHEFSLHVHVDKKQEFKHSVDWALRILQNIGLIYHQKNISDITVRKITYNTDPVVFTWTNESLPKNYCPKTEIDKLYNVLTKNDDGEPSILLSRTMAPEFFVKKVTYTGLAVCEPQPITPITPPTNFSPILRNPIDHINATVGELLVFRVPDDTFYDPEDQDSRILKMTLLTGDRQPIPTHSWLQFDSKNREFYGIPQLKDVGEHEYHLVCVDSGGLPASDSLVVDVRALYKVKYNVEFSMNLETTYESFVHSASMQRKFVEKLRDLFGDKDTNNIHLGTITGPSSTVVSWYNKSLNIEHCSREEIRRLELVLVNSDRTISGRVQDVMDPEFVVSSIKLQLIGSCKIRPIVKTNDILVPAEDTTARDSSDEYLVTFIVPVIVVVAMLFIAGVGACILYRRKRTGKMNIEEDGRAAFGNKGIPVIFQEELEEKPEPGTKTPVILADEKPPLAPPEYSKSGSVKLTDDSEPYQPPPPFTRTQDNSRQSRPKHTTPTYRKPPPYVPP